MHFSGQFMVTKDDFMKYYFLVTYVISLSIISFGFFMEVILGQLKWDTLYCMLA